MEEVSPFKLSGSTDEMKNRGRRWRRLLNDSIITIKLSFEVPSGSEFILRMAHWTVCVEAEDVEKNELVKSFP